MKNAPTVSPTHLPASVFCLLITLALISTTNAQDTGGEGEAPFDVGDRVQLFVDRVLVGETQRVQFTQHVGQKHKLNPLLKADQPWEGWLVEIYGTVLYDPDEKIFKMWYLAVGDDDTRQESFWEYFDYGAIACYATSRDGIHWDKPLVGTIKAKNNKPHNAVAYVDQPCVIKDPNDSDPNRRYKMLGWARKPPTGYYRWTSSDGLHWKRDGDKPVASGGDVMTGFYDPRTRKYVAFPKQGKVVRGHGRRTFATVVSEDFRQWTSLGINWVPDEQDDAGSLARIEAVRPLLDRPDDPKLMRSEFYGVGAYPHESCTLAFPWLLTINNRTRYENNAEGPMELRLAVSRDYRTWTRPFRTPVLPLGMLGEWDCGQHRTAATAIRVGDEIRLYYTGFNVTHGNPAFRWAKFKDGTPTGRRTKYTASVGLATWPLDRFVSVDGPADGGFLTSVPIRFTGQRMVINARVQPTGRLEAELLDGAGRPLKDWSRSDSLAGDSLRHNVTFDGRSDLSMLAGKTIRIRFHLKNASLFSFGFPRAPHN